MSKGTKQIRLGRVVKVLNQLELILSTLKETQQSTPNDFNFGRIHQLERSIEILKTEFDLEG